MSIVVRSAGVRSVDLILRLVMIPAAKLTVVAILQGIVSQLQRESPRAIILLWRWFGLCPLDEVTSEM